VLLYFLFVFISRSSFEFDSNEFAFYKRFEIEKYFLYSKPALGRFLFFLGPGLAGSLPFLSRDPACLSPRGPTDPTVFPYPTQSPNPIRHRIRRDPAGLDLCRVFHDVFIPLLEFSDPL
jgi:hypothetical protein